MKSLIFAAGLGTRLKELTQHTPKALVKVGGITLLERAVLKLKQAGVNEIIINAHHFAEQIISFVSQHDFGVKIHISLEKETLLDTGGGLKHAAHFFDKSPFIIYNVDVISDIDLQKMYNFHCGQHAMATLAVRNRETQRPLFFDENLQLCGTEKSHLQRLAFSGIHVVSPEIFAVMPEKEVFSITEFYRSVAPSQKIIGYLHNEDFWADMGKMEDVMNFTACC